jgi:hypothetical protein
MKRHLLLLLLVIATCFTGAGIAISQTQPVDIKKIPTYLNSTNAGTEFYVNVPSAYIEGWRPTDGWSLYIACGTRTQVTVENEAAGTKRQFQTKPNDCIRVVLAGNEIQAYSNISGRADGHPPEQVYPGAGLRITSKAPIVVYVCVKISYTSDAYLAIPTSGWGREYVVNTYQAHNWSMAFSPPYNLASMCTILAAYDQTRVFFTLVGNGITQTVGGMRIGQTKQFMMNKGDVVCVASSLIVGSTLAGSRIVASKPIGVVSGVQCADVPSDRPWCDHIIEMELPVNTWGTTYHMTKNFNRAAGPFFQLFAKEPNTNVYVNGANIAFLGTKPQTTVADWGEYNQYGTNWSGAQGNFVVSADKPISLTMFNQGQSLDNIVNDPYQIVYSPIEQYQKQIIFSTPGVGDGAGFTGNFINVVYSLTDNNTMPDHLEWGELDGTEVIWSKFKDKWGSGPSQIFSGTQEGKKWAVKNVSLPGDGVYHIRSKDKFACYSYGFSSYDSYGFPTSVALFDLSIPDTVNPDPKWLQLCNGDVVAASGQGPATVTDMPDEMDIRSNLAFVWRDEANSFNYDFEYKEFVPGEDRTTTWTATVPDKSKDGRLVLNFVDRRGNDTVIQIIYTSPGTELRPSLLDFGFLKTGMNKTMRFHIVNTSTGPKVVNRVEMKEGGQGFTFVNLVLPVSIPAGDSLAVDVIFNATVDGQFKDSVGFDICNEMVYFTELRAGVGNPQILAGITPDLPCDAQFNQVTVNDSTSRPVRLSNPGNYPLTITGATGPTNPAFTTNLGVGALSYPININPGEFVNFTVTFKPTSTISYTDQIVFQADASTPDPIATLCGEGIQASLTVAGYDWGERRIDRPSARRNYDQGSYIVLENKGTQGVLVSALTTGDVNFTVNPTTHADYRSYPIAVAAGQQVLVPVGFSPQAIGPHTYTVTATSNIGDRSAQLDGIGIVPRVSITSPVQFGSSVVAGDPTTSVMRKVVIKNTVFDNDDVLTITDLVQTVAGSVQEVITNPTDWVGTTQGFRYNKNQLLNTPIVLAPGDSIEFDAEFYSATPGAKQATLSTVSDAENQVSSIWIGQVTQTLTSDIALTGGSVGPICINSNGTIQATIRSTGASQLNISNIRFATNPGNMFTITTPLNYPIQMNVGETRVIDIAYAPNMVGTHLASLEVTSDATSGGVQSAPVTGIAESFARNFTVTGPATPVDIGSSQNVSIRMDAGADISLANVKEVQLTLNYQDGNEARILNTTEGNIVINPVLAAQGWEIVNKLVSSVDGIATFTLRSTGAASLNSIAGTEVATIQFLTTLDRAVQQVALRLSAVAVGNSCVNLTTTNGVVNLNPTCALSYRGVVGSGVNFALANVNPNPVSTGTANIDFSVGYTAPTEIVIYNTQGQVVTSAVRQTLQPGHYTVSVPVEALSNGAYYYKMTSGTYTETKELIISK